MIRDLPERLKRSRQWFLLSAALLLIVVLSSCSSPLLLEQTRVIPGSKPTPMPQAIGLNPDGQPCTGKGCPTGTQNNKGTNGNNGNASNGGNNSLSPLYGSHLIDTWDNVHLFLTFSYNINNPGSVAKYYDFVWGAQVGQYSSMRASNPNMLISYYIPFDRDGGAYNNSDLGAQHSLSYWRGVHPDWVLYRCDRSTPAYIDGEPNISLDFTNPAVVAWQVQTFGRPASDAGFDALGTDNVNLEDTSGACGHYDSNGNWVQLWSGNMNDVQYRNDMLTWMTRLQAGLHALPNPIGLIPNLSIAPLAPSDPFVQQVINHIDGVLDEGGFTQYGAGYLTDARWAQMVQFIKNVQNQGKPYYILNEFNAGVGTNQIEWALASYLMCKEHSAALFTSGHQQYGIDQRYPQYSAQIGTPTNEMYQDQNVYWRKYTGGLVVVNPSSSSSYTVNLPGGNYTDIGGGQVGQSLTLPPHTGKVLLGG